jgi:hypothetical protein
MCDNLFTFFFLIRYCERPPKIFPYWVSYFFNDSTNNPNLTSGFFGLWLRSTLNRIYLLGRKDPNPTEKLIVTFLGVAFCKTYFVCFTRLGKG